MKSRLTFLFFIFLTGMIVPSFGQKKPRIGIAGIAIECSTFSPARTAEDAFRKRSGDALLNSSLDKDMPMPDLKARFVP